MVLVLLAGGRPAAAAWSSLSATGAPERENRGLVFHSAQGDVFVSALSPQVVRVRFVPTARRGRDHSYAVIDRDLGDPQLALHVGEGESALDTSALRVTVAPDPLRVRFATRDGEVLDEDDARRGMAVVGESVRVWKALRDDEHVYGLGEKNGRLDKRGWRLGGYSYTMWNTDTYAYDMHTDPIYASIPFYMVVRKGRAHGIFFDNTYRSTFDIGRESQDMLSFGAEGGDLDYYFIDGPTPKEVIERYTQLTGRMPLPPRWALAYHQCRYSYYPEAKVREIAAGFRKRRIPGDVIWLDIHYQDGYRPFTWDHERFPDPKKLIADLRAEGFRVVTIVDPHPAKAPGYAPYDSGLAGDHFVKRADGTVYEAAVWPSQAEKNPEPSVFPDFTRAATRRWWGSLYAPLVDIGVAGVWNDMNEPSVFDTASGTMPLDNRHDNEGRPTDHREIHNVYGMEMTRASYDGLRTLRPNERPFVLSRASYAGGQRYSALWPGDNQSDWSHLRGSLATLMGLGLSGFPFVGSDIGGFAVGPTADLYTRWLQAAVFAPFMRTHAELTSPEREPWSYGGRYEAINRRAIELRYELLPEVYNVMKQSSDTGLPALRPVFVNYPADEKTYDQDDSFLFGDDLLVAPVTREGATRRGVYLPQDDWYDFWTGARVPGGQVAVQDVTLASLPIYVRGGAFVFRQPVVQHTGQMSGLPLRVDVYPAARSRAVYYEDDGETFEYQKDGFFERDFSQERTAERCTLTVGAVRGTYRPAARELELRVRGDRRPARVSVGGEAVRWSWDPKGWATVRLHDRPEAIVVALEAPPAPQTASAATPRTARR
jgi:alpha-glucosidase